MHAAHAIASGMGGMRTAGDLVGRTQMTLGMRLKDGKRYVAEKLGVSELDLVDPIVMREVRRELGLGLIPVEQGSYPDEPGAIEAKFNIGRLLDIPINSVERFKVRAGLD
jgi:dimethylamine--corrinoid protein Co-methyltransferase